MKLYFYLLFSLVALALPVFAQEPPATTPVAPGEHPRLFFREADVVELRRRAETPEGKAIVANLRALLAKEVPLEQVQQPITRLAGLWAAGQAFAYTLSGDQADADAARKYVDAVVDAPVIKMQELRRGTRYMGVAIAYDLCFHAWPEDYREKVASYLAARADGLKTRKEGREENPAPQSNHNVQGRAQMGVIALAIHNDPGAGDQTETIKAAQRDINEWLRVAIGDRGWGTEGQSFTLNCLNWGVLQFAQAYNNVFGKPATRDESLGWILPLTMMQVVDGHFAYFSQVVAYWNGADMFASGMWAHGLPFAPEELRPAFKTFFDQHFGLNSPKPFDMGNPSEAIYLFTSYPFGGEGKPLAEVLPKTIRDSEKSFFVFRSGYDGPGDVAAIVYLHSDVVRKSWRSAPSIRIVGFGTTLLSFDPTRNPEDNKTPGATVNDYAVSPDGSGTLRFTSPSGAFDFAADFADGARRFRLTDHAELPLVLEAGGDVVLADDGKTFTVTGPKGGSLSAKLTSPTDSSITVAGSSITLPPRSSLELTLTP